MQSPRADLNRPGPELLDPGREDSPAFLCILVFFCAFFFSGVFGEAGFLGVGLSAGNEDLGWCRLGLHPKLPKPSAHRPKP